MRLTGLLGALHVDPALARAVEAARDGHTAVLDIAAPVGARPAAVAALAAQRPLLAVTATGRAA
ncbi:MAG TPA: hypothetical protein VFD41_11150, partial [Actinomycetales bacterium]|nr:hypothetical protein [Actinomycetales bacterium]